MQIDKLNETRNQTPPRSSCTCYSGNLEDLVLHRGVAAGGGRGGSSGCRSIISVASLKVVCHLRVELLSSLLGGAAAAAATATTGLLATTSGARTALRCAIGGVLDIGGRLGLSLGGRDALAESLGLRDQIGGCDNDLDLDSLLVSMLA